MRTLALVHWAKAPLEEEVAFFEETAGFGLKLTTLPVRAECLLDAACIKASFEDCVLSLGPGAGSMQAVLYTSPWRGACIEKGTLEIKSLDVARDVMKATRHSSLMLVRAPGGRGFHVSGCW